MNSCVKAGDLIRPKGASCMPALVVSLISTETFRSGMSVSYWKVLYSEVYFATVGIIENNNRYEIIELATIS